MTGLFRVLILCAALLGPLSALAAAVFEKVMLSPDFSFLYEQDTLSEVTVLQLAIRGGKRAEGGLPGLAWLTLRMGLEPQSTTVLYEMMAQGTSLSTQVYGDYAVVSLRVLSDHLPQALDLLKKSLFDPLFNSIRLSALRESMQNQRDFMNDSPPSLAYLTHLKAFFPEDAYGTCEYGDEAGAKKIKTADIKSFYAQGFNLANLGLAVNTNLSKENISGYLRPLFAGLDPGKRQVLPGIGVARPPTKAVHIPKVQSQVLISTAFCLPAETPEQRLMSFLLKTLLSDGVGSRLWGLRFDHKLIYSSTSELVHLRGQVLMMINLSCEEAKGQNARQALEEILADLGQKGIGWDEFAQVRAYGLTTFLRDSENRDERTLWSVQKEMLDIPVDFLSEFAPMTEALSLQTFNEFLKTVLSPDKRSQVIIGPAPSEAPVQQGQYSFNPRRPHPIREFPKRH
jgi:predicted Zn-dependent peptidase